MATQYEIVDLIGRDSYSKLAKALAGERVYIPVILNRDHILVQVLGYPVAKLLSDGLGGEVVHIAKSAVIQRRNQLIRDLRVRGLSDLQIAKIANVCERSVRQIASEIDDEERRFIQKIFCGKERRRFRYVPDPDVEQLGLFGLTKSHLEQE